MLNIGGVYMQSNSYLKGDTLDTFLELDINDKMSVNNWLSQNSWISNVKEDYITYIDNNKKLLNRYKLESKSSLKEFLDLEVNKPVFNSLSNNGLEIYIQVSVKDNNGSVKHIAGNYEMQK